MKQTFTQQMTWLHTWSGLIFGWALFAIFLTGTLCVFWIELNVWARPELHAPRMPDRAALTQWSLDYLQKNAPDTPRWTISLPSPYARSGVLALSYQDRDGKSQSRQLVPDGSGREVTTETHGGRFFVDFHWTLNIPPPYVPDPSKTALPFVFVGAAGLAFLLGTITGVLIHKKIFTEFFTFRPRAKSRQRRWQDVHTLLGVLPWPFHVLIIVTGLAYLSFDYLPAASTTLNGDAKLGLQYLAPPRATPGPPLRIEAPAGVPSTGNPIIDLVKRGDALFEPGESGTISVRNPGGGEPVTVDVSPDRDDYLAVSKRFRMSLDGEVRPMTAPSAPVRSVWETMTAMHFVLFGGTAMRLLYFFLGAAGTAMMAVGLLLFTIKRREKGQTPGAARFHRLVDRINVAVIGGPMVACMGYLWAVRLLPHDFPPSPFFYRFATMRFTPFDQASRLDWELYVFWGVWAAAAAHAALRSPGKAWVEQLGLLSLLCLGLPVLGYLVPNSGMFAMMAAGDWRVAGVDLMALVFGLAFAWGAWKVAGRSVGTVPAAAPSPSAAE